MVTKVMTRVACHKPMHDKVEKWRKQHEDWSSLAAFVLSKNTGRRFKKKKKKKKQQKAAAGQQKTTAQEAVMAEKLSKKWEKAAAGEPKPMAQETVIADELSSHTAKVQGSDKAISMSRPRCGPRDSTQDSHSSDIQGSEQDSDARNSVSGFQGNEQDSDASVSGFQGSEQDSDVSVSGSEGGDSADQCSGETASETDRETDSETASETQTAQRTKVPTALSAKKQWPSPDCSPMPTTSNSPVAKSSGEMVIQKLHLDSLDTENVIGMAAPLPDNSFLFSDAKGSTQHNRPKDPFFMDSDPDEDEREDVADADSSVASSEGEESDGGVRRPSKLESMFLGNLSSVRPGRPNAWPGRVSGPGRGARSGAPVSRGR